SERQWKGKTRALPGDLLSPKSSRVVRAGSQGYADGIDNLTENGFGRLRFLLQGSVARAGHNAVRKHRNGQLLEIVRQAILAALKKCTGLRCTLQHQGSARADAERQMFGFSGAIHNFKRIIVQAAVYFDAG